MAFNLAQKFVAVSIPSPLAKELANQIESGSYNFRRLTELGLVPDAAKYIVDGIRLGTFSKTKAAEFGITESVADLIYREGINALPYRSSIVYAGDSITEYGNSNTATDKSTLTRGFSTWSQAVSRQIAFMPSNGNAGVSGNTSTQLLARYDADVIAKKPKLVVLLIGTNDVNVATGGNGATIAATANANIASMLSRNAAIGARTILIKVLPRGSVGTPMSADQLVAWNAINAFIGQQGSALVTVLDAESVMGLSDANHTINTDLFYPDLVHPNVKGGYALGQLVAGLISSKVRTGDVLFKSNTDPLNYVVNGFMTGAGPIATGWNAGDTLDGVSVVRSTVPRSDGYGNWQQQVFSGTAATGNGFARIRRNLTLTGVLNAGATVQLAAEIETEAGSQGIEAITLQMQFGTVAVRANNRVGGLLIPAVAHSGVITSPEYVLAADAGVITYDIIVWFTNAPGAVTGTIRVGRVALGDL